MRTPEEITELLALKGFRMISDPTVTGMSPTRRFICGEGHEWETTLALVLGKKQTPCPHCAREAWAKEVKEALLARGFEMLDAFVNMRTPCRLKCAHGHEWLADLANVYGAQKSGCPVCASVTEEEIIERVRDRGFELISPYVDTQTRSTFRCKFGHEWTTPLNNVTKRKNPSGCPGCAKSGFNPSKPAYFYVVGLYGAAGDYVGFGITEKPDIRLSRHKHSAALKGYSLDVVNLAFFDNGADAHALERLVIETTPCEDTGIEGFRREAALMQHMPSILNIVSEATS